MNLTTKMEKVINTSYRNIRGLIVIKNGETVYENYYNGHNAESTLHIFSTTKSILSILIGIALDKGLIESLDQKILEFFPDYTIVRGEHTIQNISINDMMTMTVPYKCKVEPYAKVLEGDDWITPALDLMGGKGRIGEFRYSPMIGTHVLSGILTHAVGMSLLDFANENLFTPLGITGVQNIEVHNREEFKIVEEERRIRGWVRDPQNYNTAAWGLILKTSDMAKIGQLFLNRGVWNGRQIVSEKWVSESTREHSRYGSMPYGYLWWVIDDKEHIYAAMGQGGNIIYVDSKADTVVAIAAVDDKNAKDTVKLIREYICTGK